MVARGSRAAYLSAHIRGMLYGLHENLHLQISSIYFFMDQVARLLYMISTV